MTDVYPEEPAPETEWERLIRDVAEILLDARAARNEQETKAGTG